MKNKYLFLVIILLIVGFFLLVWPRQMWKGSLINPNFQNVTNSSPTPTPVATPKTFKFDKTTNLKLELNKVNPQVLDSDFE